MQLLKLTCSYISLHTVTWACMQFPELAYSSLSLHAVTWACIQFPGLACSSFLRLSSSQEFRSACSILMNFPADFSLWKYMHAWVHLNNLIILIFWRDTIDSDSARQVIWYLLTSLPNKVLPGKLWCFNLTINLNSFLILTQLSKGSGIGSGHSVSHRSF